ncbi:hypothetical protein FACS189425_09370 [Clostridia bacterium]|nr:hypothetical protein FACS189425_09370 [Clostridia bacterium]
MTNTKIIDALELIKASMVKQDYFQALQEIEKSLASARADYSKEMAKKSGQANVLKGFKAILKSSDMDIASGLLKLPDGLFAACNGYMILAGINSFDLPMANDNGQSKIDSLLQAMVIPDYVKKLENVPTLAALSIFIKAEKARQKAEKPKLKPFVIYKFEDIWVDAEKFYIMLEACGDPLYYDIKHSDNKVYFDNGGIQGLLMGVRKS